MSKRKKKSAASQPKSHQAGTANSVSQANASEAGSRGASSSEPAPLVGLEPTNPPKKNVPFLAATAVLFLTWIGVLLWIAFTS